MVKLARFMFGAGNIEAGRARGEGDAGSQISPTFFCSGDDRRMISLEGGGSLRTDSLLARSQRGVLNGDILAFLFFGGLDGW
jgi:hypothetical protein